MSWQAVAIIIAFLALAGYLARLDDWKFWLKGVPMSTDKHPSTYLQARKETPDYVIKALKDWLDNHGLGPVPDAWEERVRFTQAELEMIYHWVYGGTVEELP